jgi:hypothetical protein
VDGGRKVIMIYHQAALRLLSKLKIRSRGLCQELNSERHCFMAMILLAEDY